MVSPRHVGTGPQGACHATGRHLVLGITGGTMPFNPSDLPWWGWFLCSGALFFAAFVGFLLAEDAERDARPGLGFPHRLFVAAFCIAGLLSGLLGAVRFVRWAWAG